jgi:hypothetical protein
VALQKRAVCKEFNYIGADRKVRTNLGWIREWREGVHNCWFQNIPLFPMVNYTIIVFCFHVTSSIFLKNVPQMKKRENIVPSHLYSVCVCVWGNPPFPTSYAHIIMCIKNEDALKLL